MNLMIIVGVGILLVFLTVIGILSRFRKCKSDQILVVYGKTGGNKSAKCIQGGAAFVWPVIQGYQYMDLSPLQFDCNLQKALSSQNIRVDVPTTVTIAISTDPEVMQNAAERLLELDDKTIENLVRDIVYGQMRTIIADMTIEELNADRDKFLGAVKKMIDTELRKLGLMLININIIDIKDEAGYIEALGKKAQSLAINNANVEIAKAQQMGAVQVAEQVKIQNSTVAETKKQEAVALAIADRDRQSEVAEAQSNRDSKVAEAEKKRDVSVAKSKSEGQIGQIEANKAVAISNAELEVIQAEADGRARSAEERAFAEIEKNKELAGKDAEDARALREEAKLKADIIVPSTIDKQQKLIEAEGYQLKLEKEAEANANKVKIEAKGTADAIKAKGLAEAEVVKMKGFAEAEAKEKSLLAEANGFSAMIKAAESNPAVAIQYKMVSEWEKISTAQVEAFKHMELGNVTVMDTSNGKGLTEFMQSLMSTVAPALNVMKSMDIPGVSKALQNSSPEELN
jgi:flotillin